VWTTTRDDSRGWHNTNVPEQWAHERFPIMPRGLRINRCKGISRLTVMKLNYDFFSQNFFLYNKDLKKERNKRLKFYII